MTKLNDIQLVRIARVKDSWQANLLRSELEAENIPSQSSGEQLSNWQIGIPSDVSVMVREQDRLRATAIADQFLAAMNSGKVPAHVDVETASDQQASDEVVSTWRYKQRKWFGVYMVLNLLGMLASIWAVQANHFVLAVLLITGTLLVALARYLRRLPPRKA